MIQLKKSRFKNESNDKKIQIIRDIHLEEYNLLYNTTESLRTQKIILNNLLVELKNKTEKHQNKKLTYGDLHFVGGYLLYEQSNNQLILLQRIGLTRRTSSMIEKDIKNDVKKLIKENRCWGMSENKLLFIFYKNKNQGELIMHIEVNPHYKDFFTMDSGYTASSLYDLISIVLEMMGEFKERNV